MKTLIFSDTHLSNSFDEHHFNALTSVISDADQVIINGDFWDVYLTSFDDFLASEWQKLFPLLKQKNALYLYGNHDKPEYTDERVALFSSTQAFEHSFVESEKAYTVMHGHLHVPEFDDKFPRLADKFSKHYPKLDKIKKKQTAIGKISRKFDSKYRKRLHKKLVLYANQRESDDILICGHTHFRSVDDSKKYINPGDFRNGWARYVLIENDQLTVVEERYT
ncbi:MAG: metallophosphoesterase family protein [Microgenomates group bacterium]